MDEEKRFTKAKKKRKRTVITPHEMEVLESSFRDQPRPDRFAKMRIAKQLGKPENFISIWFQNRRARERKSTSHLETATALSASFPRTPPMLTLGPVGASVSSSPFFADQEEPLDLSESGSTKQKAQETSEVGRVDQCFLQLNSCWLDFFS